MMLWSRIKKRIVSAAPAFGGRDSAPFKGFDRQRVPTRYVDSMSDDDLRHLNALLPWSCFTVDSHGRRFGGIAWKGKRDAPQIIPDRRIKTMDEAFKLNDRTVLEVGCFEGVHTTGLLRLGAKVIAVDSRIENVVKTIVRAAMFGYSPTVFLCNLDVAADLADLPEVDLIHHVGVLYHLQDPVRHLLALGKVARKGIMLDTHVAVPDTARSTYDVDGNAYRYQHYKEGGRAEVFSGMYDHAKWLLQSDVEAVLGLAGFTSINVVEKREERNGLRILLFASR
jgi:2-polyprenyl-3-methyl-5-hydroxy-6-metoxy-1,4-benzoquinol methylase